MIIKLFLAIILIMMLWTLLRRLSIMSPEARRAWLLQWALPGLIAVFVLLAITGHMNWVFAAVASLFAGARRLLPWLRYLPFLNRQRPGSPSSSTASEESPTMEKNPAMGIQTNMDVAQARETLGLDDKASHEAILQAHRRLIQKLHPDRGGSVYLAGQVNMARDVLLAQAHKETERQT